MIQKVTDVLVSFAGENLRQATRVVQEIKSGNWGVGGSKALELNDVKAIQAGTPSSSLAGGGR
jgi:phenylpyruvate tautomerase PptA (4-oxalocrotonate tautomerase family)